MRTYPHISIDEIKALHRPGPGRHWFDPETLKFFQTQLPGYGWQTPYGNFFITSETGPSGAKRFTIRVQNATGSIDTVGKFNWHETFGGAREQLRTHLESLEFRDADA